jgi:hypothetical protein
MMTDAFELPCLEEIEKMSKQRSQAIEDLEISGDKVKCQKCGSLHPIATWLTPSESGRIAYLKKRIRWAEINGVDTNNDSSWKHDKEELVLLLKEEEKNDLLRRLPLYSCRIIRFRRVCGKFLALGSRNDRKNSLGLLPLDW